MDQLNKRSVYGKGSLREWIAVICCIAMIAGMFFSRILLSFSMLVMFVNALHPQDINRNFRIWKKSRFAWFSLSFFLVYFLSGLWSENKAFWFDGVTNKLPFAVLPFAFLAAPLYKVKFQKVIVVSIVLMQLAIVGNSLLQLCLHQEFYLQGYSVSRPLPTTKYGDHIRFSLSLVLVTLMCFYLLFEQQQERLSRWLKIFLALSSLVFIVYVHILAAKTGLVCLYLMGFMYTACRLARNNKMLALALILFITSLPFIAYYKIPTFRTKVDYVFYEVAKSKAEKRYDYTLSDAGRMITYEIGIRAIGMHPLLGVGAGDIMDEMRAGYKKYYPEVSGEQQFGPINQFMFTALCVGIPLMLSLLAMTICSFVSKGGRQRLYLTITSVIMLFSIMVESMLELQFGVFTYLFFILFWMSALSRNENKDKPKTLGDNL